MRKESILLIMKQRAEGDAARTSDGAQRNAPGYRSRMCNGGDTAYGFSYITQGSLQL